LRALAVKAMAWSVEDVKELKEKHPQHRQIEKVFYYPLAHWIKRVRPKSRIYIEPAALGIDVIERNQLDELAGYEVKMVRLKRARAMEAETVASELGSLPYSLDPTPIIQGIGQAINYLPRGMDYAYLVAPKVRGLEYLPSLLRREAPSLGLVLFDRDLNFTEVLKPRKAVHYTSETRRVVLRLLGWHRSY